jgi:hypothetical protein
VLAQSSYVMLVRISTRTICQPNQRWCAENLQALLSKSL